MRLWSKRIEPTIEAVVTGRNVAGLVGHLFLATADFRVIAWSFCKVSPPPRLAA